jgi:hypothetical protein
MKRVSMALPDGTAGYCRRGPEASGSNEAANSRRAEQRRLKEGQSVLKPLRPTSFPASSCGKKWIVRWKRRGGVSKRGAALRNVLYSETDPMIFSREYVSYLARQVVKQLINAKVIRTQNVALVTERVHQAILEELSLEDRINEEVRVILEAYQDDMRRTGASYPEMFKKVKLELAKKYKAVL